MSQAERLDFPVKNGTYDWHGDYYRRALRSVENAVGKKYELFLEEYGEREIGTLPSVGEVSQDFPEQEGWLSWFEKEHPALYLKYAGALDRVVKLWGDMTGPAMEEFKAAVKIEAEAIVWAVNKYVDEKISCFWTNRPPPKADQEKQESLI